jgi:hypothetical protein
MAIGLVLQFDGVNAAKYDAIMKELGLSDNKGSWPDGIVSHMAGSTPEGWCVVDVWESQAQFDKFLSSRLKPAFDRVGGMPQPRVTAVQLHNTYRRG